MATITIQPSDKDCYPNESSPDSNNGSSQSLVASDQVNMTQRPILQFDLTGHVPAGQTITVATLYLYYDTASPTTGEGKTIWVYKQTRTNWIEDEASWNSYKTDSSWTTPGVDYVTSSPVGASAVVPASFNQWMTWDVRAIVQGAYSDGDTVEFLVKHATEGLEYASSSHVFFPSNQYAANTTLRPKLYIEYEASVVTAKTLWIEGIELHYGDGNGAERKIEGSDSGDNGTAYKIGIEAAGTKFRYADVNGDIREFEGSDTSVNDTVGKIGIESGGTKFRYVDANGDKREQEGTLV